VQYTRSACPKGRDVAGFAGGVRSPDVTTKLRQASGTFTLGGLISPSTASVRRNAPDRPRGFGPTTQIEGRSVRVAAGARSNFPPLPESTSSTPLNFIRAPTSPREYRESAASYDGLVNRDQGGIAAHPGPDVVDHGWASLPTCARGNECEPGDGSAWRNSTLFQLQPIDDKFPLETDGELVKLQEGRARFRHIGLSEINVDQLARRRKRITQIVRWQTLYKP